MASSSELSITWSKRSSNEDDNEASAYAEQIALLISFPMAMQTAIKLDLLEMIGRAHQITAIEVAQQLHASDKEQAADMVDRILRMLASFSVVTCSVDVHGCRVYGLSPVGRYFVPNEDNTSFAPLMSLCHDQVLLKSWSMLEEAILGGGTPFNKVHGMPLFDYSRSDPRFNRVFNLAMLNHTTVVMKKLLHTYKGFENVNQLVDVAGGLGHTLKMILSKFPTIKGINFDLPHVIDHAISFPGIDHISGDMFESVPAPTEVIFLKWILHDWSDKDCVKLLKNCYNALLNNGKVIVVEHVLDNDPETTTMASKAISVMDVLVMTLYPNGRERTRKEFIALANAAGFTAIKFICHACNYWVMEFFKY